MIKSKPAALPLYYASTHSLMAVVVLTVEVTLPATPPAVSSGKSATLRLPLSIINGGVLQTHAAELRVRLILKEPRKDGGTIVSGRTKCSLSIEDSSEFYAF